MKKETIENVIRYNRPDIAAYKIWQGFKEIEEIALKWENLYKTERDNTNELFERIKKLI